MDDGARRIGPYRLTRLLGEGGQGTVHEAVREHDGARVALKQLHPRTLLLSPDAVERLRREVHAARAVSPLGVVHVLDAGQDAGSPFVVYELVPGARPLTAAFAGHERPGRVCLVR